MPGEKLLKTLERTWKALAPLQVPMAKWLKDSAALAVWKQVWLEAFPDEPAPF